MDMTITIGDQEFPGRLPLMPRRYRFNAAYYSALLKSLKTEDDQEAEDAAFEVGLIIVAGLGMCWNGDPLGVKDIRQMGYDWGGYGEVVLDALMTRGFAMADVMAASRECRKQIETSIPKKEDLEEAMDPTEDQEAESTQTTSSSA